SRAAMDEQLLRVAQSVGVTVHEGTAVAGIKLDGNTVTGVIARESGVDSPVDGEIFVDATGRSAVLSKFAARELNARHSAARPYLIGFKTHLFGVAIEQDVCEIYS